MINVQHLASKVFDAAGIVAPQIFLAGGAVRDTLLERTVNDLDFYFIRSDDIVSRLSCAFDIVQPEHSYSDLDLCVFNTYIDGVKIQLIEIIAPKYKRVLDYISKRFDIGLSCAAMNWKGDVLLSAAFIKDATEKTITFYPRAAQPDPFLSIDGAHNLGVLMEYVPKIHNKYSDHQVVVDYSGNTFTKRMPKHKWNIYGG